MKIHIHIHHHHEDDLNLKLNTIMANIRDLSNKVDQLQASLDAEQQQIIDAIAQLEQTVEELQQIVADGGTEVERQALSDKLDSVISDLQSTISDSTTSTTTTSSTTEIPNP